MSNDRALRDKVIIITGGCGDIGGATTRKLSSLGARVVVWDILEEEAGRARVKELGGAEYARVDQGDSPQVHAGVQRVVEHFGKLDVTIANAVHASLGRLLDRTWNDWQESFRVNVTGSAMLAQAAVKIMLAQPPDGDGIRGRLLFTSSWVGKYPYPGSIDYCASKAALDHLVRLIAQEYAAHGIHANAISPGILKAGSSRKALERKPELIEMMLASVPVGELGTPEQVADVYAFLCSRESRYITGHILFVDGGCSLTKRE